VGMLVCLRVHVGCNDHGHYFLALLELDAAELNIPPHEARFCKLDGGDEAQEFLDSKAETAWVLHQPITQRTILEKFEDRSADQMRRRLRSCPQQEKDHGNHLISADAAAFGLDADKLADEAI